MDIDASVRQHVLSLLRGGNAHIRPEDVLNNFPEELTGRKIQNAPHTAWQLLEHLRIAQWDILEFSRDSKHTSPDYPSGYWPSTEAPPDRRAWNASVRAFMKDLKAMDELVENPATDLYSPIPHGEGQTILREALLIADHNAYHIGQLVLLRRLLGAWKE
jgi:hypothetical protein